MTDKDISFLVRLAAVTVCFIVTAMVIAMLVGLFHPGVENQEIFKIIGPAFSGVVGCLTTVIGAAATFLAMKKDGERLNHTQEDR